MSIDSEDSSSIFARAVVHWLLAAGSDAHVVGGAVRDRLLSKPSQDLDVVVGAPPLDMARSLASDLKLSTFVLDSARGHVRVFPSQVHRNCPRWVDISWHGGDLVSELRRRDFTVNCMAVPLDAWANSTRLRTSLIDPFDGMKDLERRQLRAVGRYALTDDPLRMARAARLALQLDFRIERVTRNTILSCAGMLANVPGERIREELFAILESHKAATGLALLDELGLLSTLIPELDDGRGVSQPSEHHVYDVFEHNLRTVEAVDKIFSPKKCAKESQFSEIPWSVDIEQYFGQQVADGQSRLTLLKMAGLLHDVAKPEKRTVEMNGRIRFIGHQERGAEMSAGILRRLRCGRSTIHHVATMVKNHLRPAQMSRCWEHPSERALFRYYRDTGTVALDTLYLHMADYLAAQGHRIDRRDWRTYMRMMGAILSFGFDTRHASKPVFLLTGHEVMAEFGIDPGPKVGALLRSLREAEANGLVQTREEALELLAGLI